VIAKASYRKLRKSSTFAIHQAAARLSPSGGTTFQTTFPLSFGKSFMKIRSAVLENGCLIVLVDGKNRKKNKKNNCKTYTHLPPTGRRLRKLGSVEKLSSMSTTTFHYWGDGVTAGTVRDTIDEVWLRWFRLC